MKKLIIYLLLSIGFVVMIMPFAWMIITSFKMPSEVQQWPPKWYTKNFFSKRDVKVETKIGAVRTLKGISLSEALSFTSSKEEDNVLNISVEDDPFYRGVLTIDIKGFDYIERLSNSQFQNWLKNVDIPIEIQYDTPENFFEEVFLYFNSGSKPYFNRLEYISNLTGKFDSAISGINLISKFVNRRIKDKSEQEKFKIFLNSMKEQLFSTKEIIKKYKAGKYLVLENDEIKNIYDILSSLDLNYNGENVLNKVYNNKVVDVIKSEIKILEFYLKVYDYFKNIQSKVVNSSIVAKVMSKDEKYELLKNEISKIDNPILEEILSEKDLKDLPEKFSKKVDKYFMNEYAISISQLNSLKSLIVSYKNLLIEKNIDYTDILKGGNFNDLKYVSDERLKDSNTYKIFISKLENISSRIRNLDKFLKELMLYTDYVDEVRRVYNNSMNAWKIIKAPEFVKNIRVKNGEVIEIELSNVSPIYLSDDNLKMVSLKFSFGEVIKNVFQNYVDAWNSAPFGRYYLNTVFVATATTVLEVILASMAAYAFSWMNFPGKNLIFGIFLATMMVPGEVLLVPNFITISKFGWIDTYYALIIPWIVSVFAIFLMRQHFLAIPRELFDASKIDGCSHWKFLWKIVVPLSKPVIITGALLKFVGSWNGFLWVLIVTNSDKYRTLPVGLQNFSSDVGTLYNQLMAAATFSILPVILLFLFTQQHFVRGIARTGLK
ncbi:ATPase [Thermosipho sp. 1063]|uniref:carbohydrate ABC transporter permease n=1 Tax=unclassified Thermosipho (in: thermotogales) TaxID=2676525 RepID=UPI00094923E4|nr:MULTISPECIES: carbohydrate ABC transporter permease [unclassified Thermosipho (in: thermotogales)]ANQ54482.1 ATPase [Thermosipho sp. 1070]APT72924.1 ATPase [Thermosipho sp. 1063]